MTQPLTRAELLALPAVVDLTTAGRALGIGRTLSHELARGGRFPAPVLRLGAAYRVPTAALLSLLGVCTDSEAGPASPAAATTIAARSDPQLWAPAWPR